MSERNSDSDSSSSAFALRTDIHWPPGVYYAEQTDSTNAEALRHPAALQPGTVFWAAHQTAGRGRLGRRWEDVPGKALTFSLAFPHVTEIAAVHWLHLAAGCAVAEVAEALRSEAAKDAPTTANATRLGVKWPNDVVEVSDAAPQGYRKFAGILTEVQSEPGTTQDNNNNNNVAAQRAAIGIGINVNQQDANFPPELATHATSLAQLTGRDYQLHETLEQVLKAISKRWRMIEAANLESVRKELAERDVLYGADIEVKLPTGKTLHGRAEGLDNQARLQLRTPTNESYQLESGEITRLRVEESC